jgi:hypothetical protein
MFKKRVGLRELEVQVQAISDAVARVQLGQLPSDFLDDVLDHSNRNACGRASVQLPERLVAIGP